MAALRGVKPEQVGSRKKFVKFAVLHQRLWLYSDYLGGLADRAIGRVPNGSAGR